MPTQTIDSPLVRPAMLRRGGLSTDLPLKISWGAIFAGVVASLGVWILLYALGLALGLSSVNPAAPGSLRGSGIFTGLWSLIVPLVALFVGGLVAGRGSASFTRGEGALHGLVVWGLTTVVGLWMVISLFGALLAGAGDVGKTVLAQAGGQAANMSLSFDQALAPINERLKAKGQPEVTADQLQIAARDVMSGAAAGKPINRQALVDTLSRDTSLEQQDAEQIADSVQQQVKQLSEQAQTQAAKAADATGKVFWGVFGALFLGLVASMLGGLAGAPRREATVGAVVAR